MSTKHYLKMADMFDEPVDAVERHYGITNAIVELSSATLGDFVTLEHAQYAAHAINSHDELVAENERLVNVLWEVDRVLSEMQKNGVLVYGLDDLIDEVNHSIQS